MAIWNRYEKANRNELLVLLKIKKKKKPSIEKGAFIYLKDGCEDL